MPKYEIYVDGQLIDLYPKQVIAVTYQASGIGSGNLVTRRTSFTNQISVPATNKNKEIFDYSNFINSGSTFPYLMKSVLVNANGVQIITGVVIIKSYDSKFNLQIYDNVKGLQLSIGNKMLDELDFADVAITWNQSFMDSVRASVSGYSSPLINYGQIDPTLANGTIGNFNLPSFSYKDILTTILSNAGYTVSGTFYTSDTMLNSMVMSYGRSTWPGTTFKKNEILPDDISQIDFIRDFLIRFGLFFKITDSNVEIIKLEDVLNNKETTSIDWTTKRANKKETVVFDWAGWSQRNIFSYEETEVTRINATPIPSNYNNGILEYANENADLERTVYQSIFSPYTYARGLAHVVSYQVASGLSDVYAATFGVYETIPSSFTFDNTPKPMLLVLTNLIPPSDVQPSILYNGIARTDFKVARFDQFFGATSFTIMKWKSASVVNPGLLDVYYPALQSILNAQPKTVVREYILDCVDIYSLDVLTPIFDNGQYFLINKVIEFVGGRITKVELLKIS